MRTKNLTPFLFGAKVTSLKPRDLHMTMIVRAGFNLRPGDPLAPDTDLTGQGHLTGDVFDEDDDDREGACRYASDFADFKLHAEVLLAGACHAPSKRPVTECPVRFSVGAWSKTLLVTGRRTWTQGVVGATVSDPEPFVTMPLGYENAFGGPGHPDNPAGKGLGTPELPNVEDVARPVRSKGDRPPPAGFGPINPSWPARAGKMGTAYGPAWRKDRAPFFSEDFDWTYFHAAPDDQQLPGYLRGDEEVSFVNLHPDAPIFSTRLPGLRVRAFAKTADGTIHEARMNLDTLFADLDEEKLVLTWRGLAPVKEDDLADVKTVLVASEPLADPLLPEAHYHAILEAFEADPQEIEAHAPGARRALAALDEAMKDDAAHPERSPKERAEAMGKHEDAIVGLAPAERHEEMRRAFAAAQAKLASTPVTMGNPEGVPQTPPSASSTPAEAPPPTGAMVAAAVARVSEAMESLRREGHSAAGLEELDRLLSDPETKKRLAALTPPAPEEIGPGKDLSGRTLADMDLEGRDLSGANLEGANLRGARLSGARLVGANLRMALLGGAHLEGADLSNADLTQALLTQAHAKGADLHGATLDLAVLDTTDLQGANLSGAKAKMTILSKADLTGADLRGADMHKVIADDVKIAGADLTGATLFQCSFSGAEAEGVKLAKATIPHTSFAGARLARADCREVQGEAANWSGALLEEADFRGAVMPRAHFTEATATSARLAGADLRDADLYRACLDRADFTGANLFGANLGKTTLHGTRFVNANLYASRFIGAGGEGSDLGGANVKRAIMPS